jgi:hypothetical protein
MRQEVVEGTVESGPVLFELTHENDLAWMLMPILFERIARFCAEFEPETDVAILRKALTEDFASPDPRFHALMAMEGGKCVGYSLTILEVISGILYANVTQLQVDEGTKITTQKRSEWLETIAAWARSKKCTRLHAYAHNEEHERQFRIFYGFKSYKRLLRKEI